MKPVDPAEYKKRQEQLFEILSGISQHAMTQAQTRCPYKNRHNECTANFGCRNKRKPVETGGLWRCGGDDKLDYRSAWETERRVTLFDRADELGARVPTSCGRNGTCHECIVEITSGADLLEARTEAEGFLRDPFRLACQAVLRDAVEPPQFKLFQRRPKILTNAVSMEIDLDPLVRRVGDRVLYGGEPLDEFRGRMLGLAVDLGTTTIVIDFVDFETGSIVYSTALENPQRFGGSDVMNRISYDGGRNHGELHKSAIAAINHELKLAYQELRCDRHEVYEVVIAGNSTMRDLFFDLDVQPIGQKPYKSTIEHEFLAGIRTTTALTVLAHKLGLLTHPKARVYGAPLVASHVGADTAADLLAIDIEHSEQTVMLVDVGTNTEVVLSHKGRLLAASCPAGPAFEGGLVKFGMTGCDGAIESIRYRDGNWQYETIGGVPAEGICGSGLIDLLAELRRNELMTPMGVFPNRAREMSIVPERRITLSREDASNLAQAKAANYCGQLILLRKMGIAASDIDRLYLAGGFANYIDPRHAIEIGFLAPVNEDRIVKFGNAAVAGARQMLLSQRRRKGMEEFVKRIEHVELETVPAFFDYFVDGCQFRPMPRDAEVGADG